MRRNTVSPLQQQARELDALAHIERNGNLLWWDGSAEEAQQMFRELERSGRISRHPWSGEWRVTMTPNVEGNRRPASTDFQEGDKA